MLLPFESRSKRFTLGRLAVLALGAELGTELLPGFPLDLENGDDLGERFLVVVDLGRDDGAEDEQVHSGHLLDQTGIDFDPQAGEHFDDDLLRLIFTCCHPALAQEVQVALTLKTIAGLTVPEIACAFLVPPRSNEQRITRAKRKILAARIPYEVPAAAQLPERLDAVLAVTYLLFNEGYNASGGADLIRTDLCIEAIRLARVLSRLFRAEPEVTGLLALLLLQHSRSGARLDTAGQIIPWDEQKRALWNHSLIVEGSALVEKALRQQQLGPYQVQAVVAAVYCEASQAADTDWTQIAELYDILERYQPSPVVRLNRAVAVAKVQGAAGGIALLRTVEDSPEIQPYHHFYAALGALLAEDNQAERALAAYETALLLAQNPSEQTALQKKITCLASSVSQNP